MLWLILAVAFWGFFHSFNASFGVKDFYRRVIGEGLMKFYRLFYNFVAVITFLPILVLLFLLPSEVIYEIPTPLNYLMIAGQMIFASFLIAAVFQFGILYFLGLRQLTKAEGKRELVTGGLYRHVRNPFYTFFLLFLWLTPVVTVNLFIVYLALTVYIHIGIIFEERKLLREFGSEYAEYRANTPMLIPGLKFSGNKWVSRFVLKQ
jgi:methanethiol S-methyltransferase